MHWYDRILILAIAVQLFFLLQAWNSYRYALVKFKKPRLWCGMRSLVIVPCKGLDENFDRNIASFFAQDHTDFRLWFVVEDKSDPAYPELLRLKDQLSPTSKAGDIRILVAGKGTSCSQKIHNLLYCFQQVPDDIEILAFADSDVCAPPNWLRHLMYPLRQHRYGAATGYRWFVPRTNNFATLALSAMNAKVAQLLGNTRFNQAWGGSMAICPETFRKIGLDRIWQTALSDDLSLTYAVKKAGLKLAFVPACLVASYESTTLPRLFEFARRQFLITRVTRPWTWLFGLASTLFPVLGLWGGTALAIYAAAADSDKFPLYLAVPLTFLACQVGRALFRQRMIAKMLEKDRDNLKISAWADVLLSWLWTILLLIFIISSAFGRTIRWRGIRYRLVGPTETIILRD
jgi:cellulose synthase/poly-beta-1,6-N-acetylglucosamine synthase-like glycosyltransferase